MTVAAPRGRLARTATLALLAVGACADPTLAPDGALRPRGRPSGDHTAAPATVTVAGSLQSEAGCAGDWDPTCTATGLAYDANDGVWQRALAIPAGPYEYKAALNGGWDENYGANAQPNGANIGLTLAAPATVKFYYDHATHWITDNRRAVIATAAGSFQSEMGCSGDWDPSCLRSWLQDPDGDGVYTFATAALPAGSYETKVAIDEGWDENYGQGGVVNGANIAFAVPVTGATMSFTYVAATHVLTVAEVQPPVTTVTAAGSFQSEAGCAGDWDPACAATHLAYDAAAGVWRSTFALPGGSYEAKVAMNDGWTVNYGADGVRNGASIPFTVPSAGAAMRFTYDPATHVLTIAEQVVAPTAAQQLAALRTAVDALALDRGTTTSLQAKLTAAQGAIAAGATATACSDLADFMAQVRALSGRKIPVAGATALLDAAAQVRTTLGC